MISRPIHGLTLRLADPRMQTEFLMHTRRKVRRCSTVLSLAYGVVGLIALGMYSLGSPEDESTSQLLQQGLLSLSPALATGLIIAAS